MANTKSGVVLAVGQPQQIQSKEGKVFSKRSLYVDCTTFDPYTGQRSQYENKILFDFMESKTSLLDNIQVGQVVTVYFDLQGTELTEQDGRKKFYTHVRPYKIDVRQVQPSNRQPQQQYRQPQQPTYQPPQVEDDRPF
ncbi:DUF3127 domain-containing protein [Prevotella histicola]|uniref:DUF3127 domain-containing protein n=1 Tax=Prevotella histicola TaxID=470565 RepID=UPI0028E5DB93|nr:DUF3127 domain-containing protein [Prevotella histicola]